MVTDPGDIAVGPDKHGGGSGDGAYHGRWGFETFSHRKSVYRRPAWNWDTGILNPPYTRWKKALVRRVL